MSLLCSDHPSLSKCSVHSFLSLYSSPVCLSTSELILLINFFVSLSLVVPFVPFVSSCFHFIHSCFSFPSRFPCSISVFIPSAPLCLPSISFYPSFLCVSLFCLAVCLCPCLSPLPPPLPLLLRHPLPFAFEKKEKEKKKLTRAPW